MNIEKIESIIFAVASSIIVICSLLLYSHTDLTGTPYQSIVAYQEANPHKKVTYTVTIEGGEAPIKLNQNSFSVILQTGAQCHSLARQADYLPADLQIYLGFMPNEQEIMALYEAFPAESIVCDSFTLYGVTYKGDCSLIDISTLSDSQIEAVLPLLQRLPNLKHLELIDPDNQTRFTLDQVLALQERVPALHLRYYFELFGQVVTTDMEELHYTKVTIRDSGLDRFRQIMPIMKNLTYLRLDTCKTSNEATARLREDLAPQCKVVWRVFFGQNNALTDTYKIWATWNLNTQEVSVLKYCNEVKYIDLGHNSITNLDFMAYMPDMEMAIVALNNLTDISGIANCTKLEFLEIFTNTGLTDEDMQHLAGLTNMKYLNISNLPKIRDLSFTDNMTQLRWLWCTMSYVKKPEVARVTELHPDTTFVYRYFSGDPTGFGWRYVPRTNDTVRSSVYELVRARFGYDRWDYSMDERGHLREEITFESLGLTPP